MPILFVEEDILDYKLECVLCPIKGNQFNFYTGIDALIYEKAGMRALENEYRKVNPFKMTVPSVCSGIRLSKHMVHIIGADLICAPDFKRDIYNSYDATLRLIKDYKFKSIIFPPIPFSYKRLGDMYSYRTCIVLLRYFVKLYDVTNVNYYILLRKRTMQDHLDNYVSTYVSTSMLSRRHKPINYPLKTNEELDEYLKTTELDCYEDYLGNSNYNVTIKNTKIPNLCKMIKEKFKDDDQLFCLTSNISKQSYIQLFESDYIPTIHELSGICMALKLELLETFEVFDMCGLKLSYDDARDCEVIAAIATHKYDVLSLNQNLFIKGLTQIGSYVHPSEFFINSECKV